MEAATLPVVDISALESSDEAEWTETAAAIDAALSTYGFMYVSGHGVSTEQIDFIFTRARELFEAEEAVKAAIDISKWKWHRGYGRVGAEQLDDELPPDFKETFNMAQHRSEDDSLVASGVPAYGPNQYPAIDGWQEAVDDYYECLLEVGKRLLRGVAVALGQPSSFFDERFADTVSVLRMNHYPPSAQRSEERQVGCGAHSDYGCLTLLAQDSVGGLEVQHPDGSWIAAPPIEGTFVVNVGDMLARWTHDRYKSTLHRVGNGLNADRYSIPFFVEPDFNTVVETLPSCLPEDGESKYAPVVSGEWLQARLSATWVEPGAV